jgi:hypothetical protein
VPTRDGPVRLCWIISSTTLSYYHVAMLSPHRKQGERLDAFQGLCQAVVAYLARMPQERDRLSRDRNLMVLLEDVMTPGWWSAHGEAGPWREIAAI